MKILIGYGHPAGAERVLSSALNHAKAFSAEVHIVHSMGKGSETDQKEMTNIEQDLEQVQSYFTQQGIHCQTHRFNTRLDPWRRPGKIHC